MPRSSCRRWAKRLLDLLVVTLVCLPAALVVGVAAVAIVLDSRGSPFFIQERVGCQGVPFRVIKLRTMVVGAEQMGAGLYAEQNDPRFSRVGLFLRRYSIDELPQLWNVARGEMSIVGPRPMPRAVVDEYPEDYAVVLGVRPGMTGLAQVSGRNTLLREQRLALDRHYATGWRIRDDLRILLRTARVAVTGIGQINSQTRDDVEG